MTAMEVSEVAREGAPLERWSPNDVARGVAPNDVYFRFFKDQVSLFECRRLGGVGGE